MRRLLLALALAGLPVIAHAQTPYSAVGRSTNPNAPAFAAAVYNLDGAKKRDFVGAVCDGVTDAVSQINSGMATLAAAGGGTYTVVGRCLIDSADLVVPTKVSLEGVDYAGGQLAAYDPAVPATLAGPTLYALMGGSTLIVNSARTIRPATSSRVRDIAIARKGLSQPIDMRSGVSAVASFAGTAITPNNAPDVTLESLLIVGFDRAIDSQNNSHRLRIKDVNADGNSCVRVDNSHDTTRIENLHCWGFLTYAPWGLTTVPLVGAANNGAGLVRVTTSVAHPFVTGDYVNVSAPGMLAPTYAAVTVIDATHLDIQGSTIVGAYLGGGSVILNLTRRPGTVLDITNGENTVALYGLGYGYQGGIHVGDGAGWTNLIGMSIDGYLQSADPLSKGLVVDGASYGTSWVGGIISSAANAVVINSTGQSATSIVGADINPGNGTMIQVLQGRLVMTGNHGPAAPAGMYVADLGYVDMSGNTMPGLTITYQSATAQAHTAHAINTFAAGQPVMQVPNSARTALALTQTEGALGTQTVTVGGCPIMAGSGAPAVAAPVCAEWHRTDGAAGATLYVKETGTGTTGWVAK